MLYIENPRQHKVFVLVSSHIRHGIGPPTNQLPPATQDKFPCPILAALGVIQVAEMNTQVPPSRSKMNRSSKPSPPAIANLEEDPHGSIAPQPSLGPLLPLRPSRGSSLGVVLGLT